jgi:hypothetical protein
MRLLSKDPIRIHPAVPFTTQLISKGITSPNALRSRCSKITNSLALPANLNPPTTILPFPYAPTLTILFRSPRHSIIPPTRASSPDNKRHILASSLHSRFRALTYALTRNPGRSPCPINTQIASSPRRPYISTRTTSPHIPPSQRRTPRPLHPPPSQDMKYGDSLQSPSSMASEHQTIGNVTNGHSHTINPHNDQDFHPPPLRGQQYGQPTSSHTLKPYTTQHPGSAAQKVRRKQVRATQACNHCRTRKQRCNEARPCQFCRENNFDCQYKDAPPPK